MVAAEAAGTAAARADLGGSERLPGPGQRLFSPAHIPGPARAGPLLPDVDVEGGPHRDSVGVTPGGGAQQRHVRQAVDDHVKPVAGVPAPGQRRRAGAFRGGQVPRRRSAT